MANINLTDKDNNTTISAHKDDKVVISLQWKPSTGFFWQEAGTTAGNLESIKHEGEAPLPGATATVLFVFRVQKQGEILLNYARPWSETAPPAKWFQVDITLIS